MKGPSERCTECGVPVWSGKRPRRCPTCAYRARRRWTEAAIVAAIQEFAASEGRQPSSNDFRRRKGYPDPSIVCHRFVTWNNAVAAAGFVPVAKGVGPPSYSLYRVRARERGEEIASMWEAGMLVREIAKAVGKSPNQVGAAISYQRHRGVPLHYRMQTRRGARA